MNKREFQSLLRSAIKVAMDDVKDARGDGSGYRGAVSMEGYQGGYLNALFDVEALLAHGSASDDRRVWFRARKARAALQTQAGGE